MSDKREVSQANAGRYNIAALTRMAEAFGERLEVATVSELSERGIIFVEDGNHGENRPRQNEFTSTGVAFIRPPDLKDGRVDFENCGRIDDAGFKRVRKGIGRPGDIILTHRATVGRIAITGKDAPAVFVTNPGTTIWRSTNPEVLDQKYLYCFLRSAAFMDQLWSQVGNNCTFDYVSLTQQRALRVAFPPLPEQHAIASVLGALDDKIELNRRMNETLEAMARALFQNWFVDATQAGLPKGWRMGKLRDCCERVENGGTPSRNVTDYWQPQEVPWLTSGEVRQKIVTATENFISRAGLENSSAKLWQKETTVVALYGATAGQVTLLGSEMCSNQACCALIPKSGWRFYVYLHTSSSIHALEQQVRGSAQQNLSQQIVADLPTLLPDEQTIAKFDSVVTPLIGRWICHLFESRTLAALREALLPKLLSGEVRVTDAERMMEAHK